MTAPPETPARPERSLLSSLGHATERLPGAEPERAVPSAARLSLRRVLWADALASGIAGVALIVASEALASTIFVEGASHASVVRGLGAVVLGIAALLGWTASRARPPRAAIGAILAVGTTWVLAGVPVVALGPPLTRMGMQLVIAAQVAVLGFTALEVAGVVRASSPAARKTAQAGAVRGLRVGAIAVGVFGLAFAFAPALSEPYWNLLLFRGDPPTVASSEYVRLVYGVLGLAIASWMVLVHELARGPLARGSAWAWRALTLSSGLWFVTDSVFSCHAGYEPNAISNVAFALVFALPLAALVPDAAARGLGPPRED